MSNARYGILALYQIECVPRLPPGHFPGDKLSVGHRLSATKTDLLGFSTRLAVATASNVMVLEFMVIAFSSTGLRILAPWTPLTTASR